MINNNDYRIDDGLSSTIQFRMINEYLKSEMGLGQPDRFPARQFNY